jgi:hypothetical protein
VFTQETARQRSGLPIRFGVEVGHNVLHLLLGERKKAPAQNWARARLQKLPHSFGRSTLLLAFAVVGVFMKQVEVWRLNVEVSRK